MKVLFAGSTGLVGKHALQQLLDDPRCTQLIAPTRRALTLRHPKLVNPVLEFAGLAAHGGAWQVDVGICALGTTLAQAGSRQAFRQVDHDYPLQLARLLQASGAGAFVLNSAMGAAAGSPFFYNRVKGELEQALRQLGFASLTLVRPGLIGGQREQRRPGEAWASHVLAALEPVLPRRWRINPATVVAAALVHAALSPQPGVTVIGSAELV